MPSTSATPLTKAAADEMQAAAQGAVVESVSAPTSLTKTITGTMQAASQTTTGATITSLGSTTAQQMLGSFSQLPELASAAWLATWIFQGIKHHPLIDQDKYKWYILPVLVFLTAVTIRLGLSHGDIWTAMSNALECAGPGAFLSALNYHLARPLGIFSSAADITKEAAQDEASGVRADQPGSFPEVGPGGLDNDLGGAGS